MSIITGQVFYPVDKSIFLPESIEKELSKDGVVSTIEQKIINNAKYTFLVGEQGSGKTRILAQFLDKNREKCVGVFIERDSDPLANEIAFDLYVQFKSFMNDTPNSDEFIDTMLQNTTRTFQYKLSPLNKLYIILDGLTEQNKDLERIIDLLPRSSPYVHFIISCETKAEIRQKWKVVEGKYETVSVPLLSVDEAKIILPNKYAKDAERLCQDFHRTPATITQIKRLILSGMSVDEILDGKKDGSKSLYEIEIKRNEREIKKSSEVVAILAFIEDVIGFEELSSISNVGINDLKKTVANISLLKTNDGKISFTSSIVKKLIAKKLEDYKQQSVTNIISFLQSLPGDSKAQSQISGYLYDVDKKKLLKHIDADFIKGLLEKNKSFSEIIRQTKLGVDAAKSIKKEDDYLKYAQINNFISDKHIDKAVRNEIRSLLQWGELTHASEKAASARTYEEKISLFSLIASYEIDKRKIIPEVVKQNIEEIYENIDVNSLSPQHTIDLALDLFQVFPDYSLDLINKLDSYQSYGENSSDFAFITFSLELMKNDFEKNIEILDGKKESLNDKKKSLFSAMSSYKPGTPADIVIEKIEAVKSQKNGDKIFMLRNRLKSSPEAKDNYKIINYVLELVMTTKEFSANSGFYFDLVHACKNIDDELRLDVFERVYAQFDNLKRLGPTIDFVKLQCALISDDLWDKEVKSSCEALSEYADNINDLGTRLCAYCLINDKLKSKVLQKNFYQLGAKMDAVLDRILESTADQFEIVSPSLELLSKKDYNKSKQWCSRLNTRYRCDLAFSTVIITYLDNFSETDNEIILRMSSDIKKIKDTRIKKRTLNAFLISISEYDSLSKKSLKAIKGLINSTKEKHDAVLLLAKLYIASYNSNDISSESKKCLKLEILKDWGSINGLSRKIDKGFQLQTILYDCDRDFAEEFKSLVTEIRNRKKNTSLSLSKSLMNSLDLALRAIKPLVVANIEKEEEIERLVSAIMSLPNRVSKVSVISRLISIYQLSDRPNDAKRLIENKLLNLLDSMGSDQDLLKRSLARALPVLYIYSPGIFEDYFQKITDDDFKDLLIDVIIDHIYYKKIIGDPVDSLKKKVTLSYSEIRSIIALVEKCSEVPSLYSSLNDLRNKVSISNFTKTQKADINRQFEAVIEKRFKNSTYLKHNGYYISSLSILYSFKEVNSMSEWKKLLDMANKISNVSDEIFVLCSIAELLPVKLRSEAIEIVKSTIKKLQDIPSTHDRLERYEMIISIVCDLDIPLSKKLLKEAINLTSSDDPDKFESKRSSLIDMAYKIDSDLPSSLATSTANDDDYARKNAIDQVIKDKEKEKKLLENFNSKDQIKSDRELLKNLPSITWNMLGKLNGNSISPTKRFDASYLISSLSSHSGDDSYPIISYYISVKEHVYKVNSDIDSMIRPIFLVLIENYELLLSLYDIDLKNSKIISSSNSNLLVNKQPKEAIQYLSNWLKDNIDDENKSFIIVDPYLDIESFTFIAECISKDPDFDIKILTSVRREEEMLINAPNGLDMEDFIIKYWKDNVGSESLPGFEITLCGQKSKNLEMPIHDRWWLSENSGVRIGGSINGIKSGSKLIELSKIDSEELINIKHRVLPYLNREQKYFSDEKLKYYTYTV